MTVSKAEPPAPRAEEAAPHTKRHATQSKITDVFALGRRRSHAPDKTEPPLKAAPPFVAPRKKKTLAKKTLFRLAAQHALEASPALGASSAPEASAAPAAEPPISARQKDCAANAVPSPPATENTASACAQQPQVVPFSAFEPPRLPAYQRFGHLVGSAPSLPLPAHFVLLERILAAVDGLCMLGAARDQPVVFHRVLKSLESTVGRKIELAHLAQLAHIFSDGSLGASQHAYRLRPMVTVHEGRRTDTVAIELPRPATHDYLADRRTDLLTRAHVLVHRRHSAFLDSIGVTLPPGAQLRTWHPKFDLESVTHAEEAAVGAGAGTAEAASGGQCQGDPPAPKQMPTAPATPTATAHAKAATPTSVLDRIKIKQQEAQLARMTVDPARERQRSELLALLDFAETISMYGAPCGS